MTKFNIFSIGNGISSGKNIKNALDSTHSDPKWKKSINYHPDNLYRTWADYLAMRLDARIFYIAKPDLDITKAVNLLDNTLNMVKKNYPNDINLFLLNTSSPVAKVHNLSDIHIKNRKQWKYIKHELTHSELIELMVDYRQEYDSINKLISLINEKTDYHNRIISFTIDTEILSYAWTTCHDIDFVTKKKQEHAPIKAKYEEKLYTFKSIINRFSNMEWAHVLNQDIKRVLLDIDGDSYRKWLENLDSANFISKECHDLFGKWVYEELTNDTKLLTI